MRVCVYFFLCRVCLWQMDLAMSIALHLKSTPLILSGEPSNLAIDKEALHPRMLCHHRTGHIYNYGAQSKKGSHLTQLEVLSAHLQGFNPTWFQPIIRNRKVWWGHRFSF